MPSNSLVKVLPVALDAAYHMVYLGCVAVNNNYIRYKLALASGATTTASYFPREGAESRKNLLAFSRSEIPINFTISSKAGVPAHCQPDRSQPGVPAPVVFLGHSHSHTFIRA